MVVIFMNDTTTKFKSGDAKRDVYNEAYFLSKPDRVRSLWDINDSAERYTAAVALAHEGYILDGSIDGYGNDPYLVNTDRIVTYGYTWIPSLLQPPLSVAPGLHIPGIADYNPNVIPAGAIGISLDSAKYTPFDPALPFTVPIYLTLSPVSYLLPGYANRYGGQSFDQWPVGSVTGSGHVPRDVRGIFTKYAQATPFGNSVWWACAP
jgi:hypothetical protein